MLHSNGQGGDLELSGVPSETQHWATLLCGHPSPTGRLPAKGAVRHRCCVVLQIIFHIYSCANLCQIFVLNELFSWDKNVLWLSVIQFKAQTCLSPR